MPSASRLNAALAGTSVGLAERPPRGDRVGGIFRRYRPLRVVALRYAEVGVDEDAGRPHVDRRLDQIGGELLVLARTGYPHSQTSRQAAISGLAYAARDVRL